MKKEAFELLPQQMTFCQPLPQVLGCKDYQELRALLEEMDLILQESGIEQRFLEKCMERFLHSKEGEPLSQFEQMRHQKSSQTALRCNVLRHLFNMESYRKLSMQLAQSPLLRRFCCLEEFGMVRIPSKSQLQRFSQWSSHEDIKEILEALTEAARVGKNQENSSVKAVGLKQDLSLEELLVDSSCLKAHMHFPVDWILLRDGCRSLLRTIMTIRKHGLRHRMQDPKKFISQVNSQVIAMSQSRRQESSKQKRKEILREIIRLTKTISRHGRRYKNLLEKKHEKTDLSSCQAQALIRHLEEILEQIPAAIEQAYERIIGERQVKNEEKILSLYQREAQVLIRGKAGAEVEFGNRLFVCEQENGLIVEHKLCKEDQSDASYIQKQLDKLKSMSGQKLEGVTADRGFDSPWIRKVLEEQKIGNGICARSQRIRSDQLKQEDFVRRQKRRAQTEARVGILKNNFLKQIPKVWGFKARELAVDWAVLTHNLWVIARMRIKEAKQEDVALVR